MTILFDEREMAAAAEPDFDGIEFDVDPPKRRRGSVYDGKINGLVARAKVGKWNTVRLPSESAVRSFVSRLHALYPARFRTATDARRPAEIDVLLKVEWSVAVTPRKTRAAAAAE